MQQSPPSRAMLRKVPTILVGHRQGNQLFHSVWNFVGVVQSLSHIWLFEAPWTAARQDPLSSTMSHSLLKPYPSSQWGHPTISSSVTPFSSCPQSFSASESFPMSQLFISGGQSIGASILASVLPMNVHGWFPLGLTGLISLLSKGCSRVFSSTSVRKHHRTTLSQIF